MNTWELTDNFTFTVTLQSDYSEIAKKLSRKKLNSQHAKQFYYHILAVYAVKDYLELLGYETDLNNSDFQDKVISTFASVADLEVKNHGKIECRAVFSDENIYIPSEAWFHRIGYIFVKINESLEEAHILGFVDSVKETEGVVSLAELQSLEDLPEYLSQQEEFNTVSESLDELVKEGVVILRQWLTETKDNTQKGWYDMKDGLLGYPLNLSHVARIGSKTANKAKLIDLGVNLANRQVILLMTVVPQGTDKFKICTRLCPVIGEKYLPIGLKLEILSETGESLREVVSKVRDGFIQLPELTGEAGDRFKIRVAFEDIAVTEEFIV